MLEGLCVCRVKGKRGTKTREVAKLGAKAKGEVRHGLARGLGTMKTSNDLTSTLIPLLLCIALSGGCEAFHATARRNEISSLSSIERDRTKFDVLYLLLSTSGLRKRVVCDVTSPVSYFRLGPRDKKKATKALSVACKCRLLSGIKELGQHRPAGWNTSSS